MAAEFNIEQVKKDIDLYNTELETLYKVLNISDLDPVAINYINKNIAYIKKHVFELQTKVDLYEQD